MKILITGGGSGLGEAITRLLANDSENKVYFTYRSASANAKKIEAAFSNAHGMQCDFGNPESLRVFLEEVNRLDVDVLIHNAYNGEFLKSYFHKISTNDFLTDFTENIIPAITLTQAVVTNFRKKKSGKIITILTSALVNTPPIGSSVYIANKAYMEKLTKVWANENAKFNITSNSVSPSFMQTAMTSSTDERMVAQMIENHPLKKLLTVEEVAETVRFLTNAPAHINGVDIVLNAGTNIK